MKTTLEMSEEDEVQLKRVKKMKTTLEMSVVTIGLSIPEAGGSCIERGTILLHNNDSD